MTESLLFATAEVAAVIKNRFFAIAEVAALIKNRFFAIAEVAAAIKKRFFSELEIAETFGEVQNISLSAVADLKNRHRPAD